MIGEGGTHQLVAWLRSLRTSRVAQVAMFLVLVMRERRPSVKISDIGSASTNGSTLAP